MNETTVIEIINLYYLNILNQFKNITNHPHVFLKISQLFLMLILLVKVLLIHQDMHAFDHYKQRNFCSN